MTDRIALAQLRALEAVVDEGSLKAAAERLGRSHPAVLATINALEAHLGVALFDRRGYRLALTDAGRALLGRVRSILARTRELERDAQSLAKGQETQLRVVIGDLTPLPATLSLLRDHLSGFTATRLELQFEAIAGPWERLLAGDADLVFHHVEPGETQFDVLPLQAIGLIPVAAPGFFATPAEALTAEDLAGATQCVIRDTARSWPSRDYYLVPGAASISVADQLMKREVIVQGLAWGHMPDFLIADDLAAGRLISLKGSRLPGGLVEIAALRRTGGAHGPVAAALWERLAALG